MLLKYKANDVENAVKSKIEEIVKNKNNNKFQVKKEEDENQEVGLKK